MLLHDWIGDVQCPSHAFCFTPPCLSHSSCTAANHHSPHPSLSAQETTPAVVRYRYQSLMAGTHTLEFQATAVTEGSFTLPPIKASAENQAEVRGTLWGGTWGRPQGACSFLGYLPWVWQAKQLLSNLRGWLQLVWQLQCLSRTANSKSCILLHKCWTPHLCSLALALPLW
jgi:hypothetical protein